MKNNKLSLLLFTGLMSISLVGCNNDDDSSGGTGPNFSNDGQAYSEVDDENVKSITIFKNDWADFNNARKNDTPVYSKIKSKINCDIEALNTSYATFEQQLTLLQADEDLPDIFLTNGPDNSYLFDRFIKNEDLLPISDWVSEEHYPNIYNYLKQFEFLRHNVSYSDGKMYFIPSTWHLEKSLYVRQDWIANLNAKLDDILVKEGIITSKAEITDEIREKWKFQNPEDLLQFYRLARAFTKYDPDNNGIDDTTGYISESNKDMDAWIYIAFDTGWNQFVKENDKYVFSDITNGSMYATNFVTRMISEGYMSIDSLTGDIDQKQSRFANGQAGMMYAHNWYNVLISGLMAKEKCDIETAKSKIAMIEPPAGKNGTHGGPGYKGFWQGFCINGNMSNARTRKCLEFYDYLLSDEGYNLLKYGVEGVHYSKDADGNYTNLTKKDQDGFYSAITSLDPATLLYALVEWTMHYKSETQTNADVIVSRHKESEKSSLFSDYPCVTTESYTEYIDGCHDLFLEQITILEKNDNNRYYDPSDDKNYSPTTFTWDDLYKVSKTFSGTWNSFVKKYNGSYNGQTIVDDYNDYINSGKAMKVNPSDYIYR